MHINKNSHPLPVIICQMSVQLDWSPLVVNSDIQGPQVGLKLGLFSRIAYVHLLKHWVKQVPIRSKVHIVLGCKDFKQFKMNTHQNPHMTFLIENLSEWFFF